MPKNGFNIQVYFKDLETEANPNGSVLNLSWKHDGTLAFMLAGNGSYAGTSLTDVRWMSDDMNPVDVHTQFHRRAAGVGGPGASPSSS